MVTQISQVVNSFSGYSSPKNVVVHGCHCRADVVGRIRKVLAMPRSWYVWFSLIGIVNMEAFSSIPNISCSLPAACRLFSRGMIFTRARLCQSIRQSPPLSLDRQVVLLWYIRPAETVVPELPIPTDYKLFLEYLKAPYWAGLFFLLI